MAETGLRASPSARAEPAAAADLMRQYEGALRAFFSRRLGSRAEVDDLVQEALSRLLASRERRNVEYPAAYLFTIASNLIADLRRSQAGTILVELPAEHAAFATPPDQENGRRLADLRSELAAALGELPFACREAFVMRRFRGMTTPDIALALGVSHRMVQKHLARAMAHIYLRLGGGA